MSPEALLTLNGWNIPFINHVKYLGVICDRRITWRLHIELIEAKAFGIFIKINSLFRSDCLSTNIKLTLHKALYEISNDLCLCHLEVSVRHLLLKLLHLKIKVLCTIGNIPRCTPVCYLHMASNLLYIYHYITKMCRQQAEVIQSHENEHVRSIGQGEARHRKYERLKLGGGQAYDRSSD
jgi:hypothetical protein